MKKDIVPAYAWFFICNVIVNDNWPFPEYNSISIHIFLLIIINATRDMNSFILLDESSIHLKWV